MKERLQTRRTNLTVHGIRLFVSWSSKMLETRKRKINEKCKDCLPFPRPGEGVFIQTQVAASNHKYATAWTRIGVTVSRKI